MMSSEQVKVNPDARVDDDSDDRTHAVLDDLAYQRLMLVNVVYYGTAGAGDRQWVLIDAGVAGSAGAIKKAAAERFGEGSRPAAIILTHGHFDHVGALETLASDWDVPIYAHQLEFPYLTGQASYPAPDPSVGGGLMAAMSKLYPRGPIDVTRHLRELPVDSTVPGMPGWRWVHVPGHTVGQVALWRESDRALIAADAFITTKQESAYAVATQRPELHGPPMYYTQDWVQARESVRRLAALSPQVAITGHGPAMQGAGLQEALGTLAQTFDEVAVPKDGYYMKNPANLQRGNAYQD